MSRIRKGAGILFILFLVTLPAGAADFTTSVLGDHDGWSDIGVAWATLGSQRFDNVYAVNVDLSNSTINGQTTVSAIMWDLQITAGTDNPVNFTLTSVEGRTVSGWFYSNTAGFLPGTYDQEIHIGTGYNHRTTLPLSLHEAVFNIGVMANGSFQRGSGQLNNSVAWMIDTWDPNDLPFTAFYTYEMAGSMQQSAIYKFTLTSSKPMTVIARFTKPAGYGEAIVPGVGETWDLSKILGLAGEAIGNLGMLLSALFEIGSMFFLNIGLIVVLYMGVTGAIAITGTKDVFKGFSKWVAYQRKLIEFMLWCFSQFLSLIDLAKSIIFRWL